jgi:hypothetical protein
MAILSLAEEVRQWLSECIYGILSSHAQDVPGYPFGSVVLYALDKEGCPYIFASHLAQHTKNFQANPRVSLTVIDSGTGDVQNATRITFVGDIEKIDRADRDAAAQYFEKFPDSDRYRDLPDFNFYRIKPVRIRYIGGFGKIAWIEPADYLAAVR